MLLTLAWRNIWRNRNRSLITMMSIGSAVLLAVVTASLQKGVFDNLVRNIVSMYTGHIQVHAKGYWDEQILDNSFELNDTLTMLQNQPSVVAVAPRLESFSLVSYGEKTRMAMVSGVLPAAEDSLTHLQSKLSKGHFFKSNDNTVMMAEGLAEKLGIGVGDTVVLLTQGYYGSTAAGKFPVGGLLHFGSPDLNERIVYLTLSTAQTWLDAPNMATALAVTIEDEDDLTQVADNMKKALPSSFEVYTWEEKMPEIVQHIKSDTAGMYIFAGVLYLLISFGIFSTLLMMLAERQREFGMLVALGMRRAKIAWMMLGESILLTLFGCMLGMAFSLPTTWYLAEHPIRFGGDIAKIYERFGFEAVFPAAMHAPIFWNQTIVVLCIGLLLSLYPVLRILKLNPVLAMRH